MNSLEVIHAINNRPRVRRDNFNRDSSACFARGGAVIHSGIHRSTAFIHAERHPEAFASLCLWKRNQKALNGFVVALVEQDSLEVANATALRAIFPGWSLSCAGVSGNPTQCANRYKATKRQGALVCTVAALTLPELVAKLRRLRNK